MKVFVVGANGRVGRKLVEALVEQGHEVLAGARNTDDMAQVDAVTAVELDLHDEPSAIAETIGQVDAVYFVAGSRGKDLMSTDLFGAIKSIQAAEKNGVKRFIHLSSMFALEPERWTEGSLADIYDFNVAKYMVDNWLINNTDLDYTIVQPGNLTEGEPSGKIQVGIDSPGQNSIANVAQVLADSLENTNTYKKVILMSDGDTPIEEALNNLD